MLPLATRLQAWLLAAGLLAAVACQAPSASPTPAPTAATAPTPLVAPAPTAPPAPAPTRTAAPVASPPPTAPAVGASRVDTLNAANSAFGSGDLKTAAGLYDRVVNTPPNGEAPAATLAIDDLADFRAAVLLLADGNDADARARLDDLQKRDPTAPLARLGNQLYDQYGMTGALRGACAQVQPQIATQAAPTLATLQGLGVSVDPATLCSVK